MKDVNIFKLLFFAFMFMPLSLLAQTAKPTVEFYSVDDQEYVTLSEGESRTTQAPCEITCKANLDYDQDEYDKVVCEWKIFKSDEGEAKPILDRYEQDVTYTLKDSGGYGIKLYVTFINNSTGMTWDYETETGFNIVISESKLTCTDGLSPNGDDINDVLKIEAQSLVKVSGVIKNRWGKTLHVFTIDNINDGWDGKVNGNVVKDGAYILHIDAIGSDGLHYKIKKVINVMTKFNSSYDSSSDM